MGSGCSSTRTGCRHSSEGYRYLVITIYLVIGFCGGSGSILTGVRGVREVHQHIPEGLAMLVESGIKEDIRGEGHVGNVGNVGMWGL